MKMYIRSVILALLIVSILTGYKHMQQSNGALDASIIIVVDNVVGSQDLQLEKGNYTNALGEKFTVSELQYFISNLQLGRKDGSVYTVPQDSSYYLIQESVPGTQTITLRVPAGEYIHIHFVLGVDSLRNTMDISKRTGVLDPASSMDNGMYWGWNSGYIFFKMEGTSDAAPPDPIGRHKYRYHIGGFGGYDAPTINNIKKISLELSKGLIKVKRGQTSTIELKADIMKAFNGPANVSIAAHPHVMFSKFSASIAENYSHMFSHHRTENK